MQTFTFWAATTLYAVATVLGFLSLSFRKERLGDVARWAMAAALVPHALALGLRWVEVGHGPYNTRYEVVSADTFLLVLTFLVASALARGLRALAVLVAPVAFLLMGWAVATFGVRREVPIIFKSWWLVLHIGFAKLFGATVILAAVCAGAYLVKVRRPTALRRLPAAERLDVYAHQFLLVAFLFLGVMIAAGSLWANQSWGRYWGWDPIETCSLVTWIGTGVILHFRVLHGWTGRRMAALTFVAFGLAMVTLFVVAIVVPTIHNSYMVGR
jgi:ABC-type transport system involved in cytochrome c biogenesis permease subunit